MSRVELVFTLHQRNHLDHYAMALAAAYVSIRQRTHAVLRLHVVTDQSVGAMTRQRLIASLHGGDEITFVEADSLPEAADLACQLDGDYSPAIIWRAWIAEYLPQLDRCLLLDCDLLVRLDLARVWEMSLEGCVLAAVLRGRPHAEDYHAWLGTPWNRYFRMGCTLMDLEMIRSNNAFQEGRRDLLLEASSLRASLPACGLLEQSLFNRFFAHSCRPMPFPLIASDRLEHHPSSQQWLALLRTGGDCILDIKGWSNHSPEALQFWAALLETPWREAVVARFLEGAIRPPEPPESPR